MRQCHSGSSAVLPTVHFDTLMSGNVESMQECLWWVGFVVPGSESKQWLV